jgi:hypothetical protein
MPKGKPKQKFGKQSLVDDALDAWEYADEDADYQRWEETQVKEGKEIIQEKPKELLKEGQTAPTPSSEKRPIVKEEAVQEPTVEIEPVLEQFDDWEAAMDALEAKISYDEEKKAKMANSKPK